MNSASDTGNKHHQGILHMAFWRIYGHLVWATKNRLPFINDNIEPRLYAQLVNKANEMSCVVHAINGMADHIHVVLSIPPKHSVSDVVKMLKGSSSHFVNHVLKPPNVYFAWQEGYGYFSLGESQLPIAVSYVQNQKSHHTQQTTNAWLERTSDLDEGSSATSDGPPNSDAIREPNAIYSAVRSDVLPF